MKIRSIEFDEKLLIEIGATRSKYMTVTRKYDVQWWVTLVFSITDDFYFKYTESKTVHYVQADFADADVLDKYIELLKGKLNSIILENGTK